MLRLVELSLICILPASKPQLAACWLPGARSGPLFGLWVDTGEY